MKSSITIMIFCLLISMSSICQTLHYDVIRNGDSMGSTIVEREVKDGSTTYLLNTKTEFRIVFLFKVEYDLKEKFEGKNLVSGTSFNTLNGSTQKETSISKKKNIYELIIDGIRTEVHEPEIVDSVSEIYFEEPHHSKKVYSAYFAKYLTIEKIGDHQYSLSSPDGTNIYTYENGIVTHVKISRDFATFSQVLKPEILAAVRNNEIARSK